MTVDEDIAWWTRQAFRTESDAALIAFGVAVGLKIAKADYGAKNPISRPTAKAHRLDRGKAANA